MTANGHDRSGDISAPLPTTGLSALLARMGGTGVAAQLIRGGLAGVVFQVLNRVLALASSVLFARLLGVDGYGVYAFAIALTGMVSVFVEAGMGPLALREAAQESDETRLSRHLRTAVMLILVVGAVICIVGAAVLVFAPLGIRETERAALLLALPLIVLAPLTRMGAAVLAGLKRLVSAQATEQFLPLLLVMIGGLALLLLVPAPADPRDAIAIQIGASTIVVVILLVMLRRFFFTSGVGRATLSSLAVRGWPFLMIAAALALNQQVDTLLVGMVLGTGEVGPYRVAAQGAALAMFSTFVINTVISPYVARYHADGDMVALHRLFVTARLTAAVLVAAMLLLFVIAGKPLISTLFGYEFIGAFPILLILTAGNLGNAIAGPCGTILSMTGHERHTARAIWIVGVINAIISTAAGLAYGVVGIAVSTALAVAAFQWWLRHLQRRLIGV